MFFCIIAYIKNFISKIYKRLKRYFQKYLLKGESYLLGDSSNVYMYYERTKLEKMGLKNSVVDKILKAKIIDKSEDIKKSVESSLSKAGKISNNNYDKLLLELEKAILSKSYAYDYNQNLFKQALKIKLVNYNDYTKKANYYYNIKEKEVSSIKKSNFIKLIANERDFFYVDYRLNHQYKIENEVFYKLYKFGLNLSKQMDKIDESCGDVEVDVNVIFKPVGVNNFKNVLLLLEEKIYDYESEGDEGTYEVEYVLNIII